MNKIYKVIWCKATQTMVAVSEFAKSKGKSSSTVRNGSKGVSVSLNTKLLPLSVLISALLVPLATVNAQTVAENDARITVNEGKIGDNETAINANKNKIDANEGKIGDNETAINANKNKIDANEGKIGDNKTAIDANEGKIGDNKTAIDANKGDITANATAIAGNTTAITDVVDALGLDVNNYDGIKYFRTNSTKADASAVGEDSIAVGPEALANKDKAVAMGHNANAKGEDSVALGEHSWTTGLAEASVAIGSDAQVGTKAGDVASNGGGSIVVGDGEKGVSIGNNTSSRGNRSIAIGDKAITFNDDAASEIKGDNIALGTKAQTVAADRATAIGHHASAWADSAVAMGDMANASGANSLAFGLESNGNGADSVAMGTKSVASSGDAVAIGHEATANPYDTISIGTRAGFNQAADVTNTKKGHINIGTMAGTDVDGQYNIGVGQNAGTGVSGKLNLALGNQAGMNIGDSNPESMGENVAVGNAANKFDAATALQKATAVGSQSKASKDGSTALGYAAKAEGTNSVAVGYEANTGDNSEAVAIGYGARTEGQGLVALGTGSVAKAPTGNAYLTGTTADSVVSVGNAGTLRRITNVADGAADQDAVTVAQLKRIIDPIMPDPGNPAVTLNEMNDAIAAKAPHYLSLMGEDGTPLGGQVGNFNNDGAIAPSSMALGQDSFATGEKTVVVGNQVTSQGKGSIGVGSFYEGEMRDKSTGSQATSVNTANGTYEYGIGVGAGTQVEGTNSIAIGSLAATSSKDVNAGGIDRAIAIGFATVTSAQDAITFGTRSTVNADSSTAIGKNSLVSGGANSIAMGTNQKVTGAKSGSFGYAGDNSPVLGTPAADQTVVSGTGTYSIGNTNSKIEANESGVFGNNNKVSSGENLRVMGNTNTIGVNDVPLGGNSKLKDVYVTGYDNKVSSGKESAGETKDVFITGHNNKVVSDGTKEQATKTYITGGDNTVNGKVDQVAIMGAGNKVKNSKTSAVIGNKNEISTTNTFVMGNKVTETIGNDVILGTGSASYAPKSAETAGKEAYNKETVNGLDYKYAGATNGPENIISVGAKGKEGRIENVAPGLIAATSTDAINGSQLHATNVTLGNVAKTTADNFGGGVTVNPDGTLTQPEYTNPITGDVHNNVGDALVAATTQVAEGDGIKVTNEKNPDGSTTYTVAADTAPITSADGVAATGGSDTQIATSKDVVNAINNSGFNLTTSKSTGTVDGTTSELINPGETVTIDAGDNIAIKQEANKITVAVDTDAIAKNTFITYKANGKDDQTVSLKDGLDFVDDDKGNIVATVGPNGEVKHTLADKITVDEVTTNVLNAGPVTINNDGIDMGDTKITNVKAGTEDGDAVNVSQLKAAKEEVKSDDKSVTVTTTQNADGANVFDLSVNTDDVTITKDPATGAIKAKTAELTNDATGKVNEPTGDDAKALATAGDIAKAINNSGFNLTTSASAGEVAGTTNELINPGETVTIDAGKNVKVTQAENKITVEVDNDEIAKNTFITYKANGKDDQTVSLKDGLDFVDDDKGNIVATVGPNGEVKHTLADDITIGGPGANGQPGKDGTVGVKGADGKTGVALNGKDGTIGIDGKDGSNADITVAQGKPGVDGAPGTTKTRIVYEGEEGPEEVATLNDGLKFVGDDGQVIIKKLNETLDIIGTATGELTDDNIGVVNKDGKLHVKLAEKINLGENGEVKAGPVTINKEGIDAGDKQITNVDSGLKDENGAPVDLENATGDTLTNAVNVGDLKNTITSVSTDAYGLKDQDGNEFFQDLGETAQIVGDDNINTKIITNPDGTNALEVSLNNEITVGGPGENGQPGKDGTIGAKGADGKTGVALNGKDGTIGIDGKDGSNADITVAQGKPGVDGKDGTTKTRIVYESEEGPEEVATLNDGLKFVGDDGKVITKKLNETLGIVGGADADKLTDDNIGVVNKDGKLTVKLAEDITVKSVTTDVLNAGPVTINKDGIDAGDTIISNVKAGVDGTDAVNVDQLNEGIASSKENVTSKDKSVTVKESIDPKTKAKSFDLSVNTDDVTIVKDPTTGAIKAKTSDLTINDGSDPAKPNGTVTADKPDSLATAGDIANAINNSGFTVTSSANGGVVKGASKELVNPGDEVEFIAGEHITIDQAGSKFTFKTNNQAIANDAQLPVVYTKADGTKVYKQPDGTFNTAKDGSGDAVDTGDIIASMQNADGSTNNPSTLANVNSTIGHNNGEGAINAADAKDAIAGADGKSGLLSQKEGLSNAATVGDLQAVAQAGLDFAGDDGKVIHKPLGNQLDIVGGAKGELSDDNIGVNANADGKLEVKLAKDLKGLNSVETIDADGNKTVQNGGGITITPADTNKKPVSITTNGLDNGGNRITNVAPGRDNTDAANVGQLKGLAANVYNKINDVDDNASAGSAAGMAAANLPQPHDPGASMVSAAIGAYRNQQALAIGVSTISDNGRWVIKGSLTRDTKDHTGAGVGVGYQW